ncbi:MAG: hypothetical protein LAT65_00830 [Saccharospirillum sp.]|nr:hypothetical protein [Saccharospirillum sp.]
MAHSLVWMPTDEIISKVPCTCVDGRTQGMRYSVAGGSFGLIVHSLSRIQARHDKIFQEEEIDQYLNLFARQVGPIYLHSDQHTLDCIYSRLGLAQTTRLKDLTLSQRRSFCELATQPEYQGCGHIKLMMDNEADYGIPQTLIKRSLKAFMKRYFSGDDQLMFDILAGRHAEERVLLLDTQESRDMKQDSALYLESPQSENRFFCHRPLKKALAERFLEAIDEAGMLGLPSSEWPAVVETHNLAAEQTLSTLAAHLPVEHLSL